MPLIDGIFQVLAFTESSACIQDGLAVFFGPCPYPAKRCAQALAEGRQLILYPWRHHREHGAHHQSVGLHLPQGFGQHFLAHIAYQLAQPGKVQLAVRFERFQRLHGPFVHPVAALPAQGDERAGT